MTQDDLEAEQDRLLAEKKQNLLDLGNIKDQLARAVAVAQETGEYADSIWWARAKSAARHKGRRDQELARELGALSQKLKTLRHSGVERKFVDIARMMLPADTFQKIMELALIRDQVPGFKDEV